MRKFFILIVLVVTLPSLCQAKGNRVRQGSRLSLAAQAALADPRLFTTFTPINTAAPIKIQSEKDLHSWVGSNRTIKLLSEHPAVVASAGATGYLIANQSEEELIKWLTHLGVHPKRMPGIIKSIKKAPVKGALVAVAVTGAAVYVYQLYEKAGQQNPENSQQVSAQQSRKDEVKSQPSTVVPSTDQSNQTNGYHVLAVVGVLALAFFLYMILHETEWVQ